MTGRAIERRLRRAVSIVAALSVAGGIASAQTAPAGPVVGSGNFFSPIVADLGKAVAFYRDGLGLEVAGTPSNADENPALRNMFGLPDARIQWTIGRPPAMPAGVEIVEIAGAGGRPADRRIQDAGAFTLIVLVRDLDAAFARVKQVGARVVTTGGAPMRVGRAGRAVIVEDPDGHFVELAQLDPLPDTSAPASANVIGVRVRLTVDDAGQAMQLYRDRLGLQERSLDDDFKDDPSVSAMLGLTGAQYRIGMTQVPGSGLIVEFLELGGVDRRAVRSNLQDPGSTRLQLRVRDIDAAVAALTKAGGAVVSLGGETVELPGRPGGPPLRVAIVRDPNNLFLVLIQSPPAPVG